MTYTTGGYAGLAWHNGSNGGTYKARILRGWLEEDGSESYVVMIHVDGTPHVFPVAGAALAAWTGG